MGEVRGELPHVERIGKRKEETEEAAGGEEKKAELTGRPADSDQEKSGVDGTPTLTEESSEHC